MTLLGRTNLHLNPLWLQGRLPAQKPIPDDWATSAFQQAAAWGCEVFDISRTPSYWGQAIRDHHPSLRLMAVFRHPGLATAPDSSAAARQIQAHLIETLSCVGHEQIDFYFLAYTQPLEEYQIVGALEALEVAKQEGQIGYLGLACETDPLKTLAFWRFHDAFEIALLPNDETVLTPLMPEANQRRVGIALTLNEAETSYESAYNALSVSGAHAVLVPYAPMRSER